jgi:predicted anti-sigma-YlaC factor YlaD
VPAQLLDRRKGCACETVERQAIAISRRHGELVEFVHATSLPGTEWLAAATMLIVTCDRFRELISARADGELRPAAEQGLDRHVAMCSACASYQEGVYALRRRVMVAAAPGGSPGAGRERPIEAVDAAGSLQAVALMRWALCAIGGTLFIVHARTIVASDTSATAHLSRHGGVFGAALGIAMLAVAMKPHRAIGLVPLTSSIAVMMSVVAVVDLITHHTTVMTESIHVVEFGGLVCLWVISGGPSRLHHHRDSLTRLWRRGTGSVPKWPTA